MENIAILLDIVLKAAAAGPEYAYHGLRARAELEKIKRNQQNLEKLQAEAEAKRLAELEAQAELELAPETEPEAEVRSFRR